ncbi:MAG: ClbS/DfsB family four-helix bundle protein [Bacteroidota bacterium]
MDSGILPEYLLGEGQKNIQPSYSQLREIIIKHTNDELFEKKRYKWTGTTSLGSYLISAISSYYD